MTARLLTVLAALTLASGCVVYDDDGPRQQPSEPVYVNYIPTISWAESGCYWDDYNQDFIWWFQGEVWDDNGRDDLTGVYADVYDAYGGWVDSFELYREVPDPDIWFSDWLQYSTNLDCYYGGYQVDFIVYDQYEEYDSITVIPATY